MPYEELKIGLEELAEKLGSQYQLDCNWDSDDCLRFARSGAEGQIDIRDHQIELNVTLGMLMSAFKSTIEREIQGFIDEHIY